MGCFTFVKLMMMLSNLVIFLGGLALLAMGIWISVDSSSFLKMLGPAPNQAMQFINMGWLYISLGAILVIMGLMGCCAANKESRCLLLMFFCITLIIFLAEVAAGIVALVYSSCAEEILRALSTPDLKDRYGSDPVATTIWNTTMTELSCCGFSNYTDFVDSQYVQENQGSLPSSCCQSNSSTCSLAQAVLSDVPGCYEQLLQALKRHGNIIGGISAGVGVLEIAAMIMSIYLYCYLDKTVS